MSNNKWSKRSDAIKRQLSDRVEMAKVLMALNIEVDSHFKFKSEGENTPSSLINKDGSLHEFNSGDHFGDIFDYLDSRFGLKYKDAIEKLEEILLITPHIDFVPNARSDQWVKPEQMKPLEWSYVEYFKTQAGKHAIAFNAILDHLIPKATKEQRDKAIRDFHLGYDVKRDRITIPVVDSRGGLRNMVKYTPFPKADDEGKLEPKMKYLYGRERILFNLGVLKNAPKQVFVIEGEKDCINAHIEGRPTITQGGAGMWKPWMAKAIVLACQYYNVPIPQFIILQDNDLPGVKATGKIYEDLKAIQPDTKMMFWKAEVLEYIKKAPHDEKSPMKLIAENMQDTATLKLSIDPSMVTKKFDYTDYMVQKRA